MCCSRENLDQCFSTSFTSGTCLEIQLLYTLVSTTLALFASTGKPVFNTVWVICSFTMHNLFIFIEDVTQAVHVGI